jgi:hypothetical protein
MTDISTAGIFQGMLMMLCLSLLEEWPWVEIIIALIILVVVREVLHRVRFGSGFGLNGISKNHVLRN